MVPSNYRSPSGGSAPLLTVIAHAVPLMRAGLASVVEAMPECDPVVGVASITEVAAAIAPDTPGLAICAYDLDDSDFIEVATLHQRRPDLTVLLLLPAPGAAIDVTSALAAGVRGVLEPGITTEDLAAAARAAIAGRITLAPGVSVGGPAESASTVQLTRRERQVLDLLSQGLGNRAIAAELFISENTVRNHVRRLHEKLGVRSRTEAVVRAAREGLVEFGAARG